MTAKGGPAVWAAVVVLLWCAAKDVRAAESGGGCAETDSVCQSAKFSDDEGLDVIALHAPPSGPKPEAFNMMVEDHEDANFRPTPLSLTTAPVSNSSKNTALEEPRGRALNFTLHETRNVNNLSNATNHDEFDLSDVTIRDGDDASMEDEVISPRILAPGKSKVGNTFNISAGICEKGGLTYENGEKLELGCDSICTCKHGKMDCEDRCAGPFFRRGKRIDDPLCSEKPTEDPCCSIMVCAGDTETEPLEMCSFGNETYNRGDTFNKTCSETCRCEIAGKISCKPRCPQPKKTSESCVEIPDPNDPCCKKVLCDVTLDDHQDDAPKPGKPKILSAIQANSSLIILDIEPHFDEDDSNLPVVEVSNDKENWNYYQLFPKGELYVKDHYKYVRLENTEEIVDVKPAADEKKEDKVRVSKGVVKEELKKGDGDDDVDDDAKGCNYKGKSFQLGEEYSDGCEALCVCEKGHMTCLKLECPTYFGVDVLDPQCVEWETIPPNFEPLPPNCCPEQVKCKNNGSCVHEGQTYKNWEQVPENVTGCEKRCYCEMGNIECQNTCPPVPALPPAHLACPPREASLQHAPDDDCCMHWVCSAPKDQSAQPPTRPDTNRNRTDFHLQGGKQPSKVLGPLSVYANANGLSDDKVDPLKKPHLAANENPFIRPAQLNLTVPNYPGDHQNNAEDILQFLQQHPELSNFPSGSVLEIHHVPPSKTPALPHANDIDSLQPNQKPPLVPIVSHGQGVLPADISLEQILEELHKNINPHGQGPLVPFPHGPPYIGHDHDASGSKTANKTSSFRPQDAFNNHYPEDFNFNQPRTDITVHHLEAIDPHTIRLAFMVPPVIVGLHGRVEVRYTFKDGEDVKEWDLQVFAPPNDLIATPSLEFDLLDLIPDKEYKIKIAITLRDLHNTPSSKIYKIRTPKDVQTTTLPPQIPIEPSLEISDINATWVTVVWRKFTEYELQFIDGVQLRYREIDGKIYTATPLIHRAVTTFTIENLKPNTKYEIGIFFIPFPGQHTELSAEHMLQFTTANLVDTYGFSVSLDVSQIKSTSVEISWNGVPYPEDKYVNIYRAIYQSDSGKEDHSTFKIAKRDSPTKTIIMDLKPGTRYRLWLEVYLTNGKIKTSNVQDFITKPRAAPALGSSSQDKISRAEIVDDGRGDYYGPLVIVAILAAIAILSTLILLLILVRRHNQNKAAITPPSTRISQSAYDNPTYKVEIQQETMGL